MGDAAIDNIELLLVRREADAVGLDEVIYDNRDASGLRIDPVDVTLLLFRLGLKPLVKPANAVSRICEPDRAVGSHHDVVWRIEPLAVVALGDHGDGPVKLGPDDAPSAMFAAHQASLTVGGVSVRIHRRRT